MVIMYCFWILGFFIASLSTCIVDEGECIIPPSAFLHEPHSFTQEDQTQSLVVKAVLVNQLKQKARSAIQRAKRDDPKCQYLYCDKTHALVAIFWEKRAFQFLAIPSNAEGVELMPESTDSIKAKGVDIDRWLEINKLRRLLGGYPGSDGPKITIITN